MNAMSELTIVIRAKSEAKLIPHLLTSLLLQDYEPMPTTKVYLADANSNDATPEIARSYRRWLDIEVIAGGLPSVGRNAGARLACTPYGLFIDADIDRKSTRLNSSHSQISYAVFCLKKKQDFRGYDRPCLRPLL